MILVSACLLGIRAKYDGSLNTQALLLEYAGRGKFIPVCPEQLGGLPTPRPPYEITGGGGAAVWDGTARVIAKNGDEITKQFIQGAHEVAKLAKLFPVTAAILKERSPSCGVHLIYDGSFAGITLKGQGVTASLLEKLNIPVYSEFDITEELLLQLLDEAAV